MHGERVKDRYFLCFLLFHISPPPPPAFILPLSCPTLRLADASRKRPSSHKSMKAIYQTWIPRCPPTIDADKKKGKKGGRLCRTNYTLWRAIRREDCARWCCKITSGWDTHLRSTRNKRAGVRTDVKKVAGYDDPRKKKRNPI